MKNLKIKILIASFAAMVLITPVLAQIVTVDEALNVANNWITLTLRQKGDWGGSDTAVIGEVQELKRGQRTIGYFCPVLPKGYIIISLRKELAPVKACSETSNMNPECDDGVVKLIKDNMERVINRIEKEVGPIDSVRKQDLGNFLKIDYGTSWAKLNKDVDVFIKELVSEVGASDYTEGEILHTPNWHQNDPYSRDCPAPPSGDDCTKPHCVVGCVATAAAQIMRYWHWPPKGVGSGWDDSYDWINMPDEVTGTSPSAQINAVAELCYEIGVAVGMDYCSGDGCASGADTDDMEAVFEQYYRYSDSCCRLTRTDYTAEGWFNEIKIQLNGNQPTQYRVPGHSVVVDGWRVLGIKQYHLNCGWAGSSPDKPCWDGFTDTNIWYTLDAIPCSDPDDEYMMVNIFPGVSLTHSLSGTYYLWPLFPYRYFNRDASGSSATFGAGQYLQFLPNIVVTSTGNIKFYGAASLETRLFTRGDTSAGVRINNGGISMYSGGKMKLY